MPAFLPNTTTTDDYRATVLGGQSTPYDRGQLLVANNPASVIVFRGRDRASVTQDEYPYVTPSLLPLVRGESELIFGVQVKSAIVGSPAQVSGYLIEPGVAGLGPGSAFTQSVAAGGGVTPGVTSVQIQKNGVLIGTEPIIDFIDAAGLAWTIADDAANTRTTIQATNKPSARIGLDAATAVGGAGAAVDLPMQAAYKTSQNGSTAWAVRGAPAANVAVPEAGVWIVSGFVQYQLAGGGNRSCILTTNSGIANAQPFNVWPGSGIIPPIGSISCIFQLNAGDSVKLSATQDSGGPLNVIDAQIMFARVS